MSENNGAARVSWVRRLFGGRGRTELEFLPSALEILETPASPTARIIALALTAFFTIALGWSYFGEVDIVAVAQGKIVPAGGVQTIQPLEIGVVRAIHVRDGQEVKKGEILVELDPTESEVDKGQVRRELLAAKVELARLAANLRSLDKLKPAFAPPKGADPYLVLVHRERLKSDLMAYESTMASLDGEYARRIAEREAIKAETSKLKETMPLVVAREKSLSELLKKGITSKVKWLEVKQRMIEQKYDLAIQGHRLAEAEAAMTSALKEQHKTEAEARRAVLISIVEARGRIEAAELALKKAEKRERQQILVSPVHGVVQQMQVHTVGGVVTPAQVMMVVVPRNAPLEIDVMLANKDKGFVEAGQAVEIKIEAFPFTKYGVVDGKVKYVSGDAIQHEQLGLVYAARISMAKTTIRADGHDAQLGPGMSATVEIKTGKRRIMEFIMAPLLRYKQESMRER